MTNPTHRLKKFVRYVGGDWRLAETIFCSKACELAATKKLSPCARHDIEMFWRDFGHTIHLYEDIKEDNE